MPRKSYPRELRERAVRMLAEVRPNYEHEYAAITAVATKLGIGTPETLRKWVWSPRSGPATPQPRSPSTSTPCTPQPKPPV
jgi:transposase-like protein